MKNYPLFCILILSAFLRFSGLGYSQYYGDETKALYLDKTIPAFEFFMDQRKGPLQFFVAWIMEKITGGYNEFFMRLPFAIAGFLSVYVFYLLVKKLFDTRVGLIAAFLFSISGFNVAFSRTVQYQSFLVLFGLLSVYLFLQSRLVLSSISLAIAFYAHYDALFYLVPILYLIVLKEVKVKNFLKSFAVPFVVLIGIFYIPYIYKGYFAKNTLNYVLKRIEGRDYTKNNSLYTYFLYNPTFLSVALLFTPLYLFFKKKVEPNVKVLLFWFIVPFLVFELIVMNPGTHVQNYFFPLFILAAYVLSEFYDQIKNKRLKIVYLVFLVLGAWCLVLSSLSVYVPTFNKGYPWKTFADKRYSLFLYGFPYQRGWDQIGKYLKSKRATGFYTDDNAIASQYYTYGISFTPPGPNFMPEYYVRVFDNQEFGRIENEFFVTSCQFYVKENEFFVNGKLTAEIYKRKTP